MIRLTQAQRAAVKALENPRGQVRPLQIVQAARNKRNPLHPLFDWNRERAAEKWWLHQARVILGAVTVQVVTEQFNLKVPAYMVDMTTEGSGYRSVAQLKTDPDSARESLIYTLEVAAGHLRRALDLAAPLGLSKEIDRLLLQIAGVARVVKRKSAA